MEARSSPVREATARDDERNETISRLGPHALNPPNLRCIGCPWQTPFGSTRRRPPPPPPCGDAFGGPIFPRSTPEAEHELWGAPRWRRWLPNRPLAYSCCEINDMSVGGCSGPQKSCGGTDQNNSLRKVAFSLLRFRALVMKLRFLCYHENPIPN